MRTNRITAVVLAFALLLFLPSCRPTTTPEDTSYQPVTVLGVNFTEPPERVVSLSPATTEMMVKLDLTGKLAACTDACILPEGTEIPSVGEGSDPNFDAILDVKPDLVISQRSLSKADLDKLNQAGIKALIIPTAEDLRELKSYYSALGAVFHGTEKGIAEAERVTKPLVTVVNTLLSVLKEDSKNVSFVYFLQLGKSAATADTFAGNILACLGVNKAEGSDYQIDLAKIKANDPTYLFVSKPYAPENLQSSPDWNTLSSVTGKKVLSFDSSLFERRSLDIADLLLDAAKTMYPDKADSIDAALKATDAEDASGSGESKAESNGTAFSE